MDRPLQELPNEMILETQKFYFLRLELDKEPSRREDLFKLLGEITFEVMSRDLQEISE